MDKLLESVARALRYAPLLVIHLFYIASRSSKRAKLNRMRVRRSWTLPIAAVMLFGIAGCAFDIAHVQQSPVTLSQSSMAPKSMTFERAADIDIGLGYRRTLKAGSTWTYFGTVPAGDVYQTRDQVLTLEASNIHEAYIVVNDKKLVGFYLPVEKAYSAAVQVATLPIK